MKNKTVKKGKKTAKKAAKDKPFRAGATVDSGLTLNIGKATAARLEERAKMLGHENVEVFAKKIIDQGSRL